MERRRHPVPEVPNGGNPVKTFSAKPSDVTRSWYVVDAEGQTLGRMATQIATVLRGKHKPVFTPHLDTGDFVIVVNAEKVKVTGGKESKKMYHRHSGYPGGLTSMTFQEMVQRNPERAVEKAVWGMLPKTRLGRKQIKKLKVYRGPEHPHAAQQPQPFGTATGAGEAQKEA